MKHLALVLAVVFAASSGSAKSYVLPRSERIPAGQKWFLSHAQLMNLTKVERKQYLRDVRKILASLPEMSHYFAAAPVPKKAKRSIANDAAQGEAQSLKTADLMIKQAESWRGRLPPVYEYAEKDRREEFRTNFKNSAWWAFNARLVVNQIPDSNPEKKALVTRLEEQERMYSDAKMVFRTSFADDGLLDSVSEAIALAKAGKIGPDHSCTPPGALVKFEDKQPLNLRSQADGNAKVCPVAALATSIQNKPVDTPTETPEAEPLPQAGGYRCMYSGFVIKQDPCKGPSELPEGMTFKGIEGLDCGEKKLCNPLLFGVILPLDSDCELKMDLAEDKAVECLAKAKPICVSKDKDATKKCAEQADTSSSLESAALLIKMNPDVWNDYLRSFYELCDDGMIDFNGFLYDSNGKPRRNEDDVRADINRTCDNARKRLSALTDQYRTVTTRPGGKTPTETGTKTEK